MRSLRVARESDAARAVCYGCFRPTEFCFCDLIPSIENQTEVLILQHQQERSHPFNTARMVHRALDNCSLLVGRNQELAAARLPLNSAAALLYPGPAAKRLDDLVPGERPQQLVILDGTWHQAKTLLRDISAISNLPRYGLDVDRPGCYRIRMEPTDTSLSTVEATVAALKILEPQTRGLDRLLHTFNTMVDRQLAHPQAKYDGLTLAQREQSKPNIPYVLIHDIENVVVVYGESAGGERAAAVKNGEIPRRTPVYWVAQKLGTGDTFQAAIDPAPNFLTQTQLEHLRLPASFFDNAVSHEQFRQLWSEFISPDNTLAVFNHSTIGLLEIVGVTTGPFVVLKSVKLDPGKRNGELDQILEINKLNKEPVRFAGRAGKRLSGVATFARHLHHIGQA